jgi:chromatin remodeling complex protein RSC6
MEASASTQKTSSKAPAKKAPVKKPKQERPAEVPIEVPAVERRPAPEPREEVPSTSTPSTSAPVRSLQEEITEDFRRLYVSNEEKIAALKKENAQLKNLSKRVLKNLKKKKNVSKSGFDIPLRVSEVMYRFLERYQVQKGELLTRNQVKNFIFRYIKEHNLQTPENRKFFHPDDTLSRIFSQDYERNSSITIMKSQAYYNHHFLK